MKTILIAALALMSVQAFAVPSKCYTKAAAAVRYSGEEAEAHECTLAPNGKAVICEVAAYKGGGDAVDTWRVVLNKTCTKVFRTELIGEE